MVGNKHYAVRSFFSLGCLYTLPAHATVWPEIIWPALFCLGTSITNALLMIIASVVIKALLLYQWLRPISSGRAFLISCVGNAASASLGSVLMAVVILLWHATFFDVFEDSPVTVTIIAHYTIRYLISCILELTIIELIFDYQAQQLWAPVLIGNFITYALVALIQFRGDLMALLGY